MLLPFFAAEASSLHRGCRKIRPGMNTNHTRRGGRRLALSQDRTRAKFAGRRNAFYRTRRRCTSAGDPTSYICYGERKKCLPRYFLLSEEICRNAYSTHRLYGGMRNARIIPHCYDHIGVFSERVPPWDALHAAPGGREHPGIKKPDHPPFSTRKRNGHADGHSP
jgi:hypothetical protein